MFQCFNSYDFQEWETTNLLGENQLQHHQYNSQGVYKRDLPVVGVLGSVCIDHLISSIILLQRKVHLQDMSTGLNDLQDSMRFLHLLLPGGPHHLHVLINEFVLCQDAGFVEEVFHHLKESRILKSKVKSKQL